MATSPPSQYQKIRRNDPDKLFKDNRTKTLLKVATDGRVPRQITMDKYNITLDEVNDIRKKNGMSSVAKTVRSEPKAVTVAKKAFEESKTEAPLVDTDYSLSSIMKYYTEHASIDPKSKLPRAITTMKNVFGITIEYTTAKRTPSTKIVSASWNGKGNLFNTINLLGKQYLDNTSLIFDNMQHLFEKVNTINEAASSKSIRLQKLLVLFSEYPAYDKVENKRDEAIRLLKKAIDDATPNVQADAAYKEIVSVVEDYDEIVRKVASKFGKTSEEYLFMKVFENVPSRDDLGLMKVLDIEYKPKLDPNNIKPNLLSQINRVTEDKYNLLVMADTSAIFVFTTYKTSNKYGTVMYKCSDELFHLLNEYFDNSSFTYNIDSEFLFKSKNSEMKQTKFVSQMLVSSGVKESKKIVNENDGSINLLRHSIATKLVSKIDIKNAESFKSERVRISKLMRHSIQTTDQYISQIKK